MRRTATERLDRRQLRELASLLCGDHGPRYRTRRELVDLFERMGVEIEEPHHRSRRQLALAGLEELSQRRDGVASIVAAITDDATPERSGGATGRPVRRDKDTALTKQLERRADGFPDVLTDVLERITKKFGEVLTRPRVPLPRTSYRPCFRLTLGDDSSAWLDAHLQATDDPSLVVPLTEIAEHSGSTFAFGRRSFSPAVAVASALDRAAGIFAPISRIEMRRPWTELDPDELSAFVVSAARDLTRAGFGVVLPAELTSAGRRRIMPRLYVAAEQPPDGIRSGLTAGTLATFRWEAALGDDVLTREEFEAIAQAKRELVRWRDTWVLVDERDIDSTRRFADKTGTMPLAQATAAVLAGAARVDGLEAEVVPEGDTMTSLLDRIARATDPPEVTEPDGFVGTLRPYQARGVGWLSHLESSGFGGCLADDMGLGKTVMLIALALRDARPTLVVCPTSVVGNWEREIERFAPSLRVIRQHGNGRARTAEALQAQVDDDTIVLTSYGLLRRDRAVLCGVDWGRVVLDEAQNIKNPSAQQTRAAYALPAPSRIALTGTPVENRLTDLWSIMQFANPGLLGPADDFADRFATPVERGDEHVTARLRRIVRPFVLRRVKSDPEVAPDLPEKFVSSVICPLTPEQATLYRAATDELLDQIAQAQGMARRGRILALITGLKQICDHPALYLKQSGPLPGRSGKLARFTEMLEEVVAEGQAALVFTQYASMGRLLKTHISESLGVEPLFLHGGTSRASRDRLVDRFQSPDGPQVFILSLKAGGTGLNLTRAEHVFHFDRWWNPAVEDQATDRTHRIGQTRNVMVHALTVSGTLEERIADLLERKRELAERIVGAGESWITELADDDLRELVALSVGNVTDLR